MVHSIHLLILGNSLLIDIRNAVQDDRTWGMLSLLRLRRGNLAHCFDRRLTEAHQYFAVGYHIFDFKVIN